MKIMNYTKLVRTMSLVFSVAAVSAVAQTFDAGSDGSYGPLIVSTNTVIDLPPDGILHCTTVMVETGARLTFKRNAFHTPVYLLATGDVVIAGEISVNGGDAIGRTGGAGGPGGFDGGTGGFKSMSIKAGAGKGPGGGGRSTRNGFAGGPGSYGTVARGTSGANDVAETYGNPLLMPPTGGSGAGGGDGSPGVGGGGGGGGIVIASNSRIFFENGSVTARGGRGGDAVGTGPAGGSGGAVRLVTPRVEGTGIVDATGGFQNGGHGRVRIDTTFKDALPLGGFDASYWSVGSFLKVFPDILPRLDVLHAAGMDIPEGTSNPVLIELPLGADTNQVVTVQARDFNEIVPLRVVLTPEAGDPLIYDVEIDNSVNNPASASINVAVPINTPVSVDAWTR
jgi:hypothetical protein